MVHERSADGYHEPDHVRKPSVKDGAALEQLMYQRIAGCGGSGSKAQLAVDRAHMGIDGDEADDEPFSDLRAGQP